MHPAQFRHQSDSRYCFSLDDHRAKLRLAVSNELNLSEVTVHFGDPMTFSRDHRAVRMERRYEDLAFVYFEGIIESELPRFMYVFYVKEGDKGYFYSESGLDEEYQFDLAFISAFQFVGENRNDYVLPKPSWNGRVFYQIFPERFACRGDPRQKRYVNTAWDCKVLKGKFNAMLGGDLYGVIDKLDYLSSLGVGAIYLTPIHPSPTNHKYDVVDYFDVDPRFGGKDAFRELVDKAHAKGMKVVMDLVFNHCAASHPFFVDVKEEGRGSRYHDWFFIDGDKPTVKPLNYRCFGHHAPMPKWDTNNPEVRDYLISAAVFWQKEFGVDGFRLDVSEGVSHDFWNRLKLALKENDPEVLLLGENWLNSESYLGPNELDGVMNYPFLGVASGYVLGIADAERTAKRLCGLLMRYKDGFNSNMLNILASHDVQRFRTLCKGDVDLTLIAYAMLVFFPGFPMIYYGEEIFMEGGGDPECRHGMEWGSRHFDSREGKLFRELLLLRQNEALKSGEFATGSKDGLLWIKRYVDGSSFTLYCNLTSQGVYLGKEAVVGSRYAGGEVWPKGFAVIND